MLFMGIDPGKSGAIVILNAMTGEVEQKKLDDNPNEICEWVRERTELKQVRVLLEKVGPYRVHGRQQGGKSMFTFGTSFGACRMLVACLDLSTREMTPAQWMSKMGVKGTPDKADAKRMAAQLFPAVKITKRNCDALLMAELLRRIENGE